MSIFKGWMKNIKKGLESVFKGKTQIGDDEIEEIEEILFQSDLGTQMVLSIMDKIQEEVKRGQIKTYNDLEEVIKKIFLEILGEKRRLLLPSSFNVILVIGVNGTGKTTFIAKLSKKLKEEGKKVLIAAADTFRAAGVKQMVVWAERVGVPVVAQKEGADPSSVVFDAISSAKAKGIDVLIVDTAGRLHTKKNLMEELKKIKRVIVKNAPDAHLEVLLTLDATTGQNALIQARNFHENLGITGLVLNKLDSTSRAG
ncbi:MAG TPA: signal recognition particle-docking protein FtsY, partial [Candidatus Atribacteria bacterium]|nr:signal recognition particle-docking protein FtsY [Candidatus Atribacteria bacterium]